MADGGENGALAADPRGGVGGPHTGGLSIVRRPLSDLHADPANTNTHDDKNLRAIADSLAEFGVVEPLVVQKGTGKVIGGNGRLAVLRERGVADVDVVELDIDDVRAAALSIALNRTAKLSTFDDGALARTLAGLPTELRIGFDAADVKELLAGIERNDGLVDPDDVPGAPDAATTQPGDIWVLGNHRLMCGDSSKPEDLDRLLDGQPIHLVNTDPPYNVKVEPRSNNAIALQSSGLPSPDQAAHLKKQWASPGTSHRSAKPKITQLRAKDRPLANDFVTDEAFAAMLDSWFVNLARVLVPGGSFYIWGGGYPGSGGAKSNHETYAQALRAHGLKYAQLIIWNKLHPVLTRKDFMGAHESCFYGWKEGAAHRFFGPNNATDLWEVKKINPQSMVHLTEKPVELTRRAIEFSSRPGENVLDLFGGSGSTLIGAEMTGRRSFLMELDALYCDVIVQRWEKFTGRKAERITGNTLAEEKAPAKAEA